eukprot:TRINITY_DN62805_c0_g1_i1.p1 TRINITY_DN62805_c0_g1~~TRINITY_DN62805_c0_g1_i1.p1  ORF type:complete len:368 (-),score=82.81 TRINITY_DN62805_c0_g1_i1:226-1329(-)
MSKLKQTEDTSHRIAFQMGTLGMISQFAFCIFAVGIASVSLVLFLRRYLGMLTYVLVGFPGVVGVVFGCIGMMNARTVTFVFDRQAGNFTASAEGASQSLSRPLSQILLVYIERERPSNEGIRFVFAVCLLFCDGYRFRLEGGSSVTGSEQMAPEHLLRQAESIRDFLRLPQLNMPLLDVTRLNLQRKMDQDQANQWMSKYMACRLLEPVLEVPVPEYDWVVPPDGVEELPRARVLSLGSVRGNDVQAVFVQSAPLVRHSQVQAAPGRLPSAQAVFLGDLERSGGGDVVIGRPVGTMAPQPARQPGARPQVQQATAVHAVPQPRQLNICIQEGQVGQTIRVIAPDGSEVSARVPPDMHPGQTMAIQY